MVGALSASDYEAPRAKEYEELMDIIRKRGRHGKDRYQRLMEKEERVLDTVDRVVNDARLQEIKRTSVLDMSLFQILGKTGEILYDMYIEAFTVRSWRDAKDLFTRSDRRIYIGLVITAIGFFLGFIQMTTGTGISSTQHQHQQQQQHYPFLSVPAAL